MAMLGAFFYLLLGGFVVLGLAGGMIGAVTDRLSRGDQRHTDRLVAVLSAVPALLAAVTLAVLEEFIGKW